jgi:hypothetical protein
MTPNSPFSSTVMEIHPSPFDIHMLLHELDDLLITLAKRLSEQG